MSDQMQENVIRLQPEEIKLIDQTSLPTLEKHHLRLLAHCLALFKTISSDHQEGSLPSENARLEWCLNNPALKDQKPFINIFLKQLSNAAEQLEEIAADLGVSCLDLRLEDLITKSSSKAWK